MSRQVANAEKPRLTVRLLDYTKAMIGFNHALVGGLIGKYLPLPIALPLSIASHFALDTLPHYGLEQAMRDKSKVWKCVFITDFLATFLLIFTATSHHRYGMLACGVIAVLPDLVWVVRFIKTRSFDMSKNHSWYTNWHAGIQHFERPWGIWVEMPLAVILFYEVILRTWYL